MPVYYAISSVDPESGWHIYGKGDDAEAAEAQAAQNIRNDDPDAPALRRNLTMVSRADAEARGIVPPGAPVVWYAGLRRYRVEDHGRFKPLPGEQRLREILR